jgi:hypothetical protein
VVRLALAGDVPRGIARLVEGLAALVQAGEIAVPETWEEPAPIDRAAQ